MKTLFHHDKNKMPLKFVCCFSFFFSVLMSCGCQWRHSQSLLEAVCQVFGWLDQAGEKWQVTLTLARELVLFLPFALQFTTVISNKVVLGSFVSCAVWWAGEDTLPLHPPWVDSMSQWKIP